MDVSTTSTANTSVPSRQPEELAAAAEGVTDPHDQPYINKSATEVPAGSEPETNSQINIVPPSIRLPVFRLEINKMVYEIRGMSIAISAEGGVADVQISLDAGGASVDEGTPKRDSSEATTVVKSIKTSLKSSRKAIVGAANKFFKTSGGPKPPQAASGSRSPECDPLSVSLSVDNDQVDRNSTNVESEFTGLFNRPVSNFGIRVTRSQENTVDSDTGTQPQQPNGSLDDTTTKSSTHGAAGYSGATTKTKTLRQLLKIPVKPLSPSEADKTQTPTSMAVAFPESMPPKVKAFYQIKQDTRLIATVYAADTSQIAEDIKQTRRDILQEQVKQKLKINGKLRSVWLCPAAGEKVEIWKLYYDKDDRCQMVLGRVPGSELYGYTLPNEIDRNKQFDSPEEQTAYEKAIRNLAFLGQDEYDVEEPGGIAACEEEVAEVYM